MRQFAIVMRKGRIVAKGAHFSLHALYLSTESIQGKQGSNAGLFMPTSACFFGMLLSKRWAAKAVRRNLIKRQIRSILSQRAVDLELPRSRVALVVRLYSGWDKQLFVSAASNSLRVTVRRELLELFQSANWQKAPTLTLATTH